MANLGSQAKRVAHGSPDVERREQDVAQHPLAFCSATRRRSCSPLTLSCIRYQSSLLCVRCESFKRHTTHWLRDAQYGAGP